MKLTPVGNGSRPRRFTPALGLASLAVLFLVLASGCAGSLDRPKPYVSAPKPLGYPLTHQPHLQAVHHWNVLAADVAQQVDQVLKTHPEGPSGPVRIETEESSPFARTFKTLLTTELINQGLRVDQGQGRVTVSYGVEMILHRTQRPKPGAATLFGRSYLPHHEVLITTTVVRGEEVLARRSDAFYANDKDAWHYLRAGQPRSFTAVSN